MKTPIDYSTVRKKMRNVLLWITILSQEEPLIGYLVDSS